MGIFRDVGPFRVELQNDEMHTILISERQVSLATGTDARVGEALMGPLGDALAHGFRAGHAAGLAEGLQRGRQEGLEAGVALQALSTRAPLDPEPGRCQEEYFGGGGASKGRCVLEAHPTGPHTLIDGTEWGGGDSAANPGIDPSTAST